MEELRARIESKNSPHIVNIPIINLYSPPKARKVLIKLDVTFQVETGEVRRAFDKKEEPQKSQKSKCLIQ